MLVVAVYGIRDQARYPREHSCWPPSPWKLGRYVIPSYVTGVPTLRVLSDPEARVVNRSRRELSQTQSSLNATVDLTLCRDPALHAAMHAYT